MIEVTEESTQEVESQENINDIVEKVVKERLDEEVSKMKDMIIKEYLRPQVNDDFEKEKVEVKKERKLDF